MRRIMLIDILWYKNDFLSCGPLTLSAESGRESERERVREGGRREKREGESEGGREEEERRERERERVREGGRREKREN